MLYCVQTSVIPSASDIDPDVLVTMNSLQCFKDKQRLVEELLSNKHTTEKVVYFLLLDRKLRQPSDETEGDRKTVPLAHDTPKKRVDSVKLNGQTKLVCDYYCDEALALVVYGQCYNAVVCIRFTFGSISEGSPVAPRRALVVHQM